MKASLQKIKGMSPSNFSLVMATGIISIAAYLDDRMVLSEILFVATCSFMLILIILFSARLIYFPKAVIKDFKSYQTGPTFFTIVASLCILGNQFILLYDWIPLARIFLVAALVLCIFFIYGFFFNITVTKDKKSLKEGISGSWLLIIVGIQALSSFIALISEHFGTEAYLCIFIALCLYLVGGIFYLYLMSLIVYRISFFSLKAKELGAPYWINMGATAITTLAGAMLILHIKQFHFIKDMLPFLKGFTLFFWAAGSWWIPLLILLGAWRHIIQKEPLPSSGRGYSSTYWAMVFPLGMYTVCCFRLSQALQINFLANIPQLFIFLALFTWAAVMIGLIKYLFIVK